MKVVIMAGVPGSGKTTTVKRKIEESNEVALHLSSDALRKEMYGNLKEGNSTEANKAVFKEMKKRLGEVVKLKSYDTVYYDATNTSRKRRRIMYNYIKEIDSDVEVQIYYISVPLYYLKMANEQRPEEEQVPESVLLKMYKNIQVPRKEVDCDLFIVSCNPIFLPEFSPSKVNTILDIVDNMCVSFYVSEMFKIFSPHDCPPYHYEAIHEHIDMCIQNTAPEDRLLRTVAIFHDLGKSVTKVLHEDGRATYRDHANVSANYYLNYIASTKKEYNKEEVYLVMEAIHQHMNAHAKGGLGKKNIRNNKLQPELIDLITRFAEVDSKSKLAEPKKVVDK